MTRSRLLSLFVLLSLLPAVAFAQPMLKVQDPANEAIQAVAEDVTERGTIRFQKGFQASPEAFLQGYMSALGLTSHDEMRENARFATKIAGEEVTRFSQFHRGIPVEGAEYVLHSESGDLIALKGRVAEGLDLEPAAAMSAEKALEAALSFVEADVYAWEDQSLELKDAEALESLMPKSELIIVRDPKSDRNAPVYLLAWRTEVKVSQPEGHLFVYTDAVSGDYVKTLTGRHVASNATGTVTTLYNGSHSFSTRKRGFPNFDFILKDKTRGEITVKQFSNFNSWGWNLAGHIDQGSNSWTHAGATAHWATQETHDYFRNVHGRSGINGSNEELRILVNSTGTFYSDDGNKSYMHFQTGFQAVDVVGHEFTHGVIRHSSNLVYELESGALNESFADTFGTMVEREVVGDANYDWLLGGDFGAVRNMENPNAFSQPDTRFGAFWWNQVGCVPTNNNDWCGVHFNSGVQNRWFSLLVDGGTENGVTVNGVGETIARRVAYRNMVTELFAGADYDDAREGAIDAAEALYGQCSNVVEQVTNAWAAVGVGAVFGNCIPPLSVSVSGPFQGQVWTNYTFNSSVSGGVPPYSYQWRVNSAFAGSGSSLTRSFSADGIYQIELRVTDNAGQVRTVFHFITIGDCPPFLKRCLEPV